MPNGADRASAQRQIALLIACQALLYVNNVALVAANGLAGLALAPTALLATLPVTAYFVGAALATMPASLAMGRFGHRAGFMFGAAAGATGAAIAAAAVLAGSFAGLCAGSFALGIYNAFAQYLRFAAADVAEAYDASLKERAISWVLAGGIAGGIVGPELSKITRDALPATYAGTFAALAVTASIAFVIASRLRVPAAVASRAAPARPLASVVAQPDFAASVLVSAVSFGAMNLLMNAAPLAMKICGFGYPQSADVIKWHVVAMFAPGFFTGALMRRFGAHAVMLAGCAALFATVAVGQHGGTYWHFWSALVALGLGWNLMFTGATLLLTATYTAGEKAKAQGANDLAVFVVTITSSAASGALVSTNGWAELNLYAAPFIALAAGAIAWSWMRQATLGNSVRIPARAQN
ncbi:MAG: MFS transporter [Betaproteobacteria bacterium]|nr:MAG: MFS transporter [Betaproteobacteria bacterium]